MPTWLGGQGTPFVLIEQGPRVFDVTLEMKIFYICQFGKHFARFFGHLFVRSEGNFFEYALHHGLSVFLIAFSFLTNQWLIGLFVLLIHDYSDFGLIAARAYKVPLPKLRITNTTQKNCWTGSSSMPSSHGWGAESSFLWQSASILPSTTTCSCLRNMWDIVSLSTVCWGRPLGSWCL